MELDPIEKIDELRAKVKVLEQIIAESDAFREFQSSEFYGIFDRTMTALKKNYLIDAYKASKSNLSNIGNLLGRMEQIDDMYEVFDKFETNREQAQLELETTQSLIKELQDEIKQPEIVTADVGGSMG